MQVSSHLAEEGADLVGEQRMANLFKATGHDKHSVASGTTWVNYSVSRLPLANSW